MDQTFKEAIRHQVSRKPFARALKMALTAIGDGYAKIEMTYEPAHVSNMCGRAHGGAIFGLIDEAFETAGQTGGTAAVALNVNVTCVSSL